MGSPECTDACKKAHAQFVFHEHGSGGGLVRHSEDGREHSRFSSLNAAGGRANWLNGYEHGKDSMYREMTEGDSADTPWGALAALLREDCPHEVGGLCDQCADAAVMEAKQVLANAREAIEKPSLRQQLITTLTRVWSGFNGMLDKETNRLIVETLHAAGVLDENGKRVKKPEVAR